ncbi:MAG: anti-sigma factor antagonist, partial [Rhodocyclaceae bacterium]
FAEDFTIYRVAELKPALIELLGEAERIELDLSGVERMDSAGCQLLMLVKREASAACKTLAIVAHSPAVQSLIEFYNLAAWFGDPLVVPAE